MEQEKSTSQEGVTNPFHQLQELGQSVWYDNIRRAMLDSGQFARYLEQYAVTGVSSNLTVLERVISGSDDYDDTLREAMEEGVDDAEEVFWDLILRDVQDAADLLRGIYVATDGVDGFVSVDLPPNLAHDTDGTVQMATELFERIDGPNIMLKVPATSEGLAASEELIFRGVNVNATLLFSLSQWEATSEAYMRGLERRLEEGRDLAVSSVASFSISQIDGKANERLPDPLQNRLGVACGRLAYAAYRRWLDSERWQRLAEEGARPQQLLWRGAARKDPMLPETYYAIALLAPGTINIMPEQTLVAMSEEHLFEAGGGHGTPFATEGQMETLSEEPGEAEAVVSTASDEGVDVEELGRELQEEGYHNLVDCFDRLLKSIELKFAELRADRRPWRELSSIRDALDDICDDLIGRDAVRRLWHRDHTLWQEDPAGVANRLGWIVVPQEMEERVEALREFTAAAVADGMTHALLLGMGGSSLFPLVVARTFEPAENALELHVLDSVDPAAIRRVERTLPLERTLVIASSKSGTTLETRALLSWFWEHYGEPERFVVITDPGTALAELGRERNFRRVFQTRRDISDIGGRYSALSFFGLVPAMLAGVDIAELLHRAGRIAAASADCVRPRSNKGLELGAILAGSARAGRDKLTLLVEDRFASFGLWIEQLIAESTGKQGLGIVPVVGEQLGPLEVYGDDRLFVAIGGQPAALESLVNAGHPALVLDLDDRVDIGAEVLRWEIATALAGAALHINPFDQPDVEASKQATRRALDEGISEVECQPLQPLLEKLGPGDYLAIQAFVDPDADVVADLERARIALRDRYHVATTLGIGPRYLHSTGQLHKGGPETGVFVQVVGEDEEDPPIPGEDFGFSTLKRGQAAGDLQILQSRGRRAGRVALEELVEAGP
ncbi:MAG: bifunctional transaldolase/phosoglucose isomerase [Nitriliruptorales bacterium]